MDTKETMGLNYVAVRTSEKTGNIFVACLGSLPRAGRLVNVEVLVDSADPAFPILEKMAALHAEADKTEDGSKRPRGFGLCAASGFALGEQSVYPDKVTGADRYGAFTAKPVDGSVELVEASPVRVTVSPAAAAKLKALGI